MTAQLSDSTGSFANPSEIGTVNGSNPSNIVINIPKDVVAKNKYRIRVLSQKYGVISNHNPSPLDIIDVPTLTFNVKAEICENEPVLTLSASPAGGTFTGTGVTGSNFDPAVAGAGNQELVYTYNPGGLGCSVSKKDTIAVLAKPAISFITPDKVCEDDSAAKLSATPSGGTFTGTGVDGTSFDPATAKAGSHIITYKFTDVKGCSNTAKDTIKVVVCENSIEDALSGISIYPLPAQYEVTIDMKVNVSYVMISDITGKQIMNLIPQSDRIQLNLSSLANGLYWVKFITAEGTVVKQILKE